MLFGKSKNKKDTNKKPYSLRKELLEDLLMVVVVLALVFGIKNYVLINAVIPSASMENTIMTGDRVFGNRLAYRNSDPERGDIVIFKNPDNEEELYIKRVIGLPGDTVEMIDGQLYINGSLYEEDYLAETPVGDYGPYEVPDGCYFMMGDNRNWSKDSRFWEHTYVERDAILAKAVFRYYPFNKIGTIG